MQQILFKLIRKTVSLYVEVRLLTKPGPAQTIPNTGSAHF